MYSVPAWLAHIIGVSRPIFPNIPDDCSISKSFQGSRYYEHFWENRMHYKDTQCCQTMSSQDSKEFHKSVHLDCFWDQGKEDRGVVE